MKLSRLFLIVMMLLTVVATVTAQDNIYTDVQGRYTVPVPTNWQVTEAQDYTLLADPTGSIKLYFLVIPSQDTLETVVEQSWALAAPDVTTEIDQVQTPPAAKGVDETMSIQYAFDPADNLVRQAVAQRVGDEVYVLLIDADLITLQQRQAQLAIVNTGYTITSLEKTDLTNATMRPVDAAMIAEWEAYIEDVLTEYGIPGAAIAVVQSGDVVYSNGFGTTVKGGGVPITPTTHMMTGSTGKSLTTTMMAAMVDAGLFDWDTPVIDVLPEFAVADPALSQTITMRNLVCACTGVPRRDFEFVFNAFDLSAEDIVNSLATFEFFTDFGEAFQYSNQMVATGGYAAGAATSDNAYVDLFNLYSKALNDYLLTPLNMENTTVSFDEVIARGNYALPHSFGLDATYQPIDVLNEQVLVPVAPAGSHWSTLEDMTDYMIMHLQNGIAPSGVQVVSEENLRVTREPQVQVTADSSYGLGWFVDEYKGLRQIQHGGNTLGFTSSFVFLPERELGVIVMTNAQYTNVVSQAITNRLFDLVFDDVDAVADAEKLAFEQQQFLEGFKVPDVLLDGVDPEAIAAYLGNYINDALGAASVMLVNGELILDIGELQVVLLPAAPAENSDAATANYIISSPPFTGSSIQFKTTDTGNVEMVFGEGVTAYTFTSVK